MNRDRQISSTAHPMVFLMVSSTDHISPLTGAVPTVTISKDGAAFQAPLGLVSEVGSGWYALSGNASDRNTLGTFTIHATAAGGDPTDTFYTIVVYDPFAAQIPANVTQWSGTGVGTVPPDTLLLHSGTAQGGTANTITLDAGASSVGGTYIGEVVFLRSGTGLGQSASISAYNGGTKVATINGNWTTIPDATSVFSILAFGPIAATVTGNVTVGGYVSGQDPGSYVLRLPSDKLATDAQGGVTVGAYEAGQDPATLVLDQANGIQPGITLRQAIRELLQLETTAATSISQAAARQAIVSGQQIFNYNRDQIIRAALRKIGAIEAGEQPDFESMQDASEALNLLVKEWMSIGIHLWTEAEGILFLQPNQQLYALGPGTTDHAGITDASGSNFTIGALLTTNPGGSTYCQLVSETSIAVGDSIGVALDGNGLFWSTVTAIGVNPPTGDPAASFWDNTTQVFDQGVKLATILSSQASAGAQVVTYRTAVTKPLRIAGARRLAFAGLIETPMIPMSRQEYMDLPNKSNAGTPTQYFYNPQKSVGLFYVWPVAVDNTQAIRFTWYREINNIDSTAALADFPQEWGSTLVFNLAAEMAPEYDVPPARFQILKIAAEEKLENLKGWDREQESAYFGMNYDQMPGS